MSQLNTGPARARTRVMKITLFGMLLLGLALAAALVLRGLPGGAVSASAPPVKAGGPGEPAAPGVMCGEVMPSSDKFPHNNLLAIAAVTASDVWAVGYYMEGDTYRTLVEHWNGIDWLVVSSPNQGTGSNRLNGVAAVSANDVRAVGYYTDGVSRTLVEHWNGSAWSVVPSANIGAGANVLSAVAVVGHTDVWAAGYYDSGGANRTLTLHWNGTTWAAIPSINQGTGTNRLLGVTAVSANNVWAVGYYGSGSTYRTLTLHWDGALWSVVASANQGPGTNYLYAVDAAGANDVWAVGHYQDGSIYRTLTLHWNGSAWSVVPSPSPGANLNLLRAIAVVAANDVWAVGFHLSSGNAAETLVEHWNGSSWQVVPSPNPGTTLSQLQGVAAFGANYVWAAGYYEKSGTYRTLVDRWNGSLWFIVTSPNQSRFANVLQGVTVVSANDVWAVGYYVDYGLVENTIGTLVEHWNGIGWSIVPSPNPGARTNFLYAVAAVAANDVWAVGDYYNGTRTVTLVERWNGSAWSVVPSPNSSGSTNELHGVAAVAANDVWAVGYQSNATGYQTLVEHWNGSSWQVAPSPNPSTYHNKLLGVATLAANDVWAVGFYFDEGEYHHTLVEHWDGISWSTVSSSNVGSGDNYLYSVAAVAANDIWAVGHSYDGSTSRALVERWNGSIWQVVAGPAPSSYSYLMAVAAVSANEVWAAGHYIPTVTARTLVQRWYGSAWLMVTSPNQGSGHNYLYGIDTAGSEDVWAVGEYRDSRERTLVERFRPCGTPTPTPNAARTPTPPACNIQFTDVPPGSTFYPFIRCLACKGLVSGYPDGTFKPNNNVTRGQLAKIVSNSAGFSDPQTTQLFQDVPAGSTFFNYIGRLASRGHMSGYPCGGAGEPCGAGNLPYFRPNANATRGQISKIVSNAAGFADPPGAQRFQDVPPASTFYDYIQRLASRTIMSGYACGGVGEPCGPGSLPYFRPNNNATRGQVSKIVGNTFFPGCQTPVPRK